MPETATLLRNDEGRDRKWKNDTFKSLPPKGASTGVPSERGFSNLNAGSNPPINSMDFDARRCHDARTAGANDGRTWS